MKGKKILAISILNLDDHERSSAGSLVEPSEFKDYIEKKSMLYTINCKKL